MLKINGDWGLGIGDWGLGIGPNPQAQIPNPQSTLTKIHFNILYFTKNFFKIIKKKINII